MVGDRDGEQYHERRNSLTEEDLANITSIFEAIQHRGHTDCRFSGIEPKDLKEMIESYKAFAMINPSELKEMIASHKTFVASVKDSKTVVRRFLIIGFLTALSGLTVAGVWARIAEMARKAISLP
jgi:hypothetical protein